MLPVAFPLIEPYFILSPHAVTKITEIIKIIQMKLKKNIQLQKTNFKNKIEYDLIYKNNLLKSLLPNFRFKYLKDFDFKKEFSTLTCRLNQNPLHRPG